MLDIDNIDIQTLFMYRYALDKPMDTVDLIQDLKDLQSFPERLNDSYRAEWLSYVKRELHALQNTQDTQKQMVLSSLKNIERGHDKVFNELTAYINIAIKVNNSSDVTVLTSPLRAYVQQLLKL